MKKLKQQNAITLVALVITIIILLILAGISISALTNQGLFGQAENARKETKRAQVTEWLNLKLMEVQMNNPTATAEEIVEATRLASDGNAELAKMGKNVVVDTNTSTIEDGEPVDVYFYVQVDEDVYKVEVAGAKFIGEKGKFPPVIIVENITPTTNSITIKIKTSRNEEGKIEFYIKKEGETEYTSKYTAEGEEAKGLEYKFENLEQNKNYSIKIVATAKNGQIKEYATDIPLGSVPAGEGLITFTPATWSNGKASTTISSTEIGNSIQYQINSTSESGWTTGTSVTGLKHGDKLYARFWDGTNGGTVATNNILDGTDPSANISLSATSVGTKDSITATVTHTDNESGVKIASCKWIYNTTSSAIGTDVSSYTGGTFSSNPQTITLSATTAGTYYLHVLTTDVAGRKVETISNAVTVKVENSVSASTATTHTAKAITYSWDDLSTIAQMISNNSSIGTDTAEVNVKLNGVDNTLGVGDTATVDGKTVRILGFNHDSLTSTTAYGATTATGKAGISFEYVTFLTTAAMNSSSTNSGGWGSCALRSTLNSTTYNSLSIKNNIKQVQKEFIPTYNSASKSTSSDYLWLLSCGEIWDNGYNGGVTRGWAIATEGSQYKYYKTKLGSTAYNSSTDITKKPNTSSASYWWLRSPRYSSSSSFCGMSAGGNCSGLNAVSANSADGSTGVAPGFSI